MRILWAKADKILPAHSGGNIRSYHILRQLASRHELIFFSYYAGPPDAEYEAELTRQLSSGQFAYVPGSVDAAGPAVH